MLEKLKSFLLVFSFCATIIERIPGVSLILGILYILVSFLDNFIINRNRILYNKNFYTICKVWVLLFCYITLITIITPTVHHDVFPINFKWIRCILFFILVYMDTFNKMNFVRFLLTSYCLVAILCAILMVLGIGIDIDAESYELGEVRLSFLGTNSNKMAMIFAYSVAILVFLYENKTLHLLFRYVKLFFLFVLVSFLIYSIFLTGSRGGLLAVFIVFLYYIFFYKKSKNIIYNFSIILFFIIIILIVSKHISNVEVMSERLYSVSDGNLGARDILFNIGTEIFINNPIIGVGLNSIPEYIYNKIGIYATTHNLYIYILAAGGILGFILFAYILLVICKTVYIKSIINRKQFIPVALLILGLIDWMKNGAALISVINYIMISLAYSISNSNNNIEQELK